MGFLYFLAQGHEAVIICSGVIVAIALGFLLMYWRGVYRVRRQIETLRSVVEALPSRATREETLTAIEGSELRTSSIAKAFVSWAHTFVVNVEEKGPRYYSTVPASEGLDVDGVAAAAINFRLMHAVPNILIGLGLLFTFAGLTAALYFAAQGATSQDVAEAQKSLNGLLGAATFKFVTSLVGLSCSLLFGLFEKWRYRSLATASHRLFALLEHRFPYVSPQQILHYAQRPSTIKATARLSMVESLEVINATLESPVGLALLRQDIARTREEAEEQTALLKTFSTDLAASIAKAINDTISPQLTSTFDRLQERIDAIGQQLNSTNTDALKNIVSSFSREFQAQAQASFDQMLTAVSLLTEKIGDHSVRFERSFEGVQLIVNDFKEVGKSALEDVQRLIGSFSSTVAQLDGLAALLGTAAEPLSRAAESASHVMRSVHETQTAASDMVQRLDSVASSFKGIDTDLTQAFNTMHSGFVRIAEDLRRFVTELDASFSKSLTGVHDATASFGGDVDNLSNAIQAFNAAIPSFHEIVERARQLSDARPAANLLPNGSTSQAALTE